MQVKELFQLQIERYIPPVAKVDDTTPATIAQEVKEFVVTSPIEEALLRFLESYAGSRIDPTDRIGVWISGFYGSGKSHFAKMISYLLHNPAIGAERVIDLFRARLDPQRPMAESIRQQLHRIQQIDNHVVIFNIEAQRQTGSIAATLYSQYLSQERGLSGNITVGRLELSLQRRGLYPAFCQHIQAAQGEAWETVRDDFSMLRPAIAQALAAVDAKLYPDPALAEKALDDLAAQEKLSIAEMAKELAAYVTELRQSGDPQRPPHLVFIIDEIGQFVGREKGRLLELQTIAEEFATHGRGGLWLVVTSQQELKGMIADIAAQQDEFGRIITRFDTRLALSAEDVERVLEDRVLKKNTPAAAHLRQFFDQYGGELSGLGQLPGSARDLPAVSEASFIANYPFLPYQISLVQDVIKAARSGSHTGFTLNTEARSMLGLCQGVILANLLEAEPGRLVTLDMVYDRVRLDLNQADTREIDKIASQLPGANALDTRVVKALYFLQQLSYLACTPLVIAHTLLNDIRQDTPADLAIQVQNSLARLSAAGFAVEKEAGVYEFLTGAKKSFEEEVNAISAKKNDQRRTVRERLGEVLRELGQVDYEKKQHFRVAIYADGEKTNNEDEHLTLHVYSPLHLKLEDNLTLDEVESHSFSHPNTVYWLSRADEDLERHVMRLFRLREALRLRQARQAKSEDDKDLLREKIKEANTLSTTVESRLRQALYNGTLVWNGDIEELDGKTTTLNPIFNRIMSRLVPHVYPRFEMAAIRPNKDAIEVTLTTADYSLNTIEPGLKLFDASNHLNVHSPALEELLHELGRRENKGLDRDGKSLLAHFEAPPYGWHPEVIRLLLAATFRGGMLSIKSGNTTYDDASVPAARDRLIKANDFKSAVFLYEPEESLSLAERQKAQSELYVMFQRTKTQDTTTALAEYIQEDLKKLNERVERLALQLRQAEYPLPETFKGAHDLIRKVITHTRPNKVLRLFLDSLGELKQLHQDEERLYQFVEKDKRLAAYRQARALLHAYDDTRHVYAAASLHAEHLAAQAETLRQGLKEGPAGEAWSAFAQAHQALLQAYQDAYAGLHQQREALYQRLSDELHAAGIQIEHFQTYACTGLHFDPASAACKTCHHGLPLLAEQLMSMPVAAKSLRDAHQAQLVPSEKKRKVTRIRVGDLLAGKQIENEAQLQETLKIIAECARQALEEGNTIEFD